MTSDATAKHAKQVAKKASSSFLSPLTVAVLVVILAVVVQTVPIPSVTGPPSAKKPFRSFEQFYPFYKSEHSNHTNRQLHFAGTGIVIILFLLNLRSVPSILFAAGIGSILCPLFQGIDHGFFEFGLVISAFLLMNKLSTGKVGVAALIPIVGYTFAWVGHFMHEHNRPATFIYPTYSLMGDFNMFYRIASGQETF